MLFLARHGFPYVGRMSGMSGAPDFMGHHAGRMEGHGTDAGPVGGMERRTPRRAAFPLEAGFCGLHARPAASMRGRYGGYAV